MLDSLALFNANVQIYTLTCARKKDIDGLQPSFAITLCILCTMSYEGLDWKEGGRGRWGVGGRQKEIHVLY